MKKKVWVMGLVVLLIFAATGTAIAYIAEGGILSKPEKAEDFGTGAEDQAKKENTQPVEVEADLKNAEGLFLGRIDAHSVEIEIDDEIRVFGLADDLRDEEFNPGKIAIKYYIENGRSVIAEADFEVPQRGEIQTAEGVFNGLADNHTVEISIDGEEMAFGLDAGISFEGIEEEEEVFVAYQENEHGRMIIIKVERMI